MNLIDADGFKERMREACPHGPNDPCTCNGFTVNGSRCICFPGHIVGCTCDIDWDRIFELQHYGC